MCPAFAALPLLRPIARHRTPPDRRLRSRAVHPDDRRILRFVVDSLKKAQLPVDTRGRIIVERLPGDRLSERHRRRLRDTGQLVDQELDAAPSWTPARVYLPD